MGDCNSCFVFLCVLNLSPYCSSPQYYAECHAIIYMVDSADRERMEESKEAFGKPVSTVSLGTTHLMYFFYFKENVDCLVYSLFYVSLLV